MPIHCVKSVRILSFSGPYFPVFGLNMERYGVSLRIQSECEKLQTRKTSNTDTFHPVIITIEVVIRFSDLSRFILFSSSKSPNIFANTCLPILLRFRWERENMCFHFSPITIDLSLVSSPTHSF